MKKWWIIIILALFLASAVGCEEEEQEEIDAIEMPNKQTIEPEVSFGEALGMRMYGINVTIDKINKMDVKDKDGNLAGSIQLYMPEGGVNDTTQVSIVAILSTMSAEEKEEFYEKYYKSYKEEYGIDAPPVVLIVDSVIGPLYQFQPYGLELQKPAIIKLQYIDSDIGSYKEDKLAICYQSIKTGKYR